MDFWRSITGTLEVELTSAEPEAALDVLNTENIEIKQLKKINELTCSFRIRRKDKTRLFRICEKRGESLRILKKQGVYWQLKRMLARPVLLAGGAVLLWMVLYLPTRVFFVQVEGNSEIPGRQILAAAEECGIRFGASRREVRSEKVKNALLAAVPELQWAGVNTSGCVATISVRERTDTEEKEQLPQVSSIIAAQDGYILSCTVTSGNGLVRVGQTVQKGQVLISGYTDCGLCIQATRAEGEVIAQTNRKLEAVMPSEYVRKGEKQEVKRKISLLFRKKRIFLWKDSGIWEGSCGRMYEEYYITLPGGFRLPVALCIEEYAFYSSDSGQTSEEEAKQSLEQFAQGYVLQQMAAGRIVSTVQPIIPENGVYRLQGEYACIEMIGKVRQEEIGDTNGKNS